MIPSFQFRGKGSGTARFHLQGRALQVSGENHPRPAPVFSPKTLPVEAVRILAPEIGNDMFHLLIANDHESKGMYRKTENRQMDKKNGTGRRSLHNVQLSLFKRDFTGMGGSRHRLFQGILQVHLQDCLPPVGSGYIILHTQSSDFLTTSKYETEIPYIFL